MKRSQLFVRAGKRRYVSAVSAFLVSLTLSGWATAALPPITQGELLVLDSNAAAGNGQLFQVNPTTGVATAIGNGFGLEPFSLVVQSPTSILAVSPSGGDVYRLNFSTGNWSSILTPPYHLLYPSGAWWPTPTTRSW